MALDKERLGREVVAMRVQGIARWGLRQPGYRYPDISLKFRARW